MLTLYYGPGGCSMASHIAIEETKAAYECKPMLLPKGEHKTEAYLKINPRGQVPALSIDGEVLTENTAILAYLAKRFPEAGLMPTDLLEEARCISAMAWFSNTVHPCFQRFRHPERFADGTAQPAVKQMAWRLSWMHCQEINALLDGKDWMMGKQYTVCDPYALVFYSWGVRAELPMNELTAYTAWKERMLKRPAVRTILEREQNIFLKAA